MKLKRLLSGFIPLFYLFLPANASQAAAVLPDSTFSIVEIVTPSDYVYDDGAERILYKGVEILDNEKRRVIKLGSTFDTPPVIRLPKGEYILISSDNAGKPIRKEISVSAKQNYIINLTK